MSSYICRRCWTHGTLKFIDSDSEKGTCTFYCNKCDTTDEHRNHYNRSGFDLMQAKAQKINQEPVTATTKKRSRLAMLDRELSLGLHKADKYLKCIDE